MLSDCAHCCYMFCRRSSKIPILLDTTTQQQQQLQHWQKQCNWPVSIRSFVRPPHFCIFIRSNALDRMHILFCYSMTIIRSSVSMFQVHMCQHIFTPINLLYQSLAVCVEFLSILTNHKGYSGFLLQTCASVNVVFCFW